MGFLRKVGKKIKKGLKKVFGGKFGKIIGGIGLALRFSNGANFLFKNEDWWGNFKNTLQNMNPFGNGRGTEAIEQVTNVMEGAPKPLGADSIVDTSNVKLIDIKEISNTPIKYNYSDTGKLINKDIDLLNTPFNELDTTGQKFAKVGAEVKDFLIPEADTAREFAGDVTRDVLGASVMMNLQGDDVDEGGYGRVANVGSFEPASVPASIPLDLPNTQAQNLGEIYNSINFGNLQSGIYG